MVLSSSVAPSAKNIAIIGDGPIEEWIAVTGGGFQRATFDMPAMLQDADLLHLYDSLLHLELADLWTRYEADRVAFLAYLKDEVGLASLADRRMLHSCSTALSLRGVAECRFDRFATAEHLANALARAKRLGKYDHAGPPAKL